MRQYETDGEFRETITDKVRNFVMASSTSSRLSKVRIHRGRKYLMKQDFNVATLK